MTIVVTEITGTPTATRRATLQASDGWADAEDALSAALPLPPGWTLQVHSAYFASYHGPSNAPTFRQLIVAQQPTPRILFLG